jgi:hypothetical protein
LTRAIEKARGAVVQSERNAKQLAEKSAQLSGNAPVKTAPAPGAGAPSAASPTAAQHSSTSAPPSSAPARPNAPSAGRTTARKPQVSVTPALQSAVEAELKQGKVALILLWDPHASVDQTVHGALQGVARAQAGRVAVHYALAKEVGSFGSFTRAVQVLQTPTVLIVNPRGQTYTLTGLTDTYSLQQAISEARR